MLGDDVNQKVLEFLVYSRSVALRGAKDAAIGVVFRCRAIVCVVRRLRLMRLRGGAVAYSGVLALQWDFARKSQR
jgi:hypothetical protein